MNVIQRVLEHVSLHVAVHAHILKVLYRAKVVARHALLLARALVQLIVPEIVVLDVKQRVLTKAVLDAQDVVHPRVVTTCLAIIYMALV